MFKNIRKTVASLFTAAMLTIVPMAVPAFVAADSTPSIQGGLCQGVQLNAPSDLSTNGSSAACSSSSTNSDGLNKIIKLVINVFSLVVGVVSVIMIIVGGLRYITSGGDSSKVGTAKNTIIYALIGLVIVALAQFIVQFVLSKATTVGNS